MLQLSERPGPDFLGDDDGEFQIDAIEIALQGRFADDAAALTRLVGRARLGRIGFRLRLASGAGHSNAPLGVVRRGRLGISLRGGRLAFTLGHLVGHFAIDELGKDPAELARRRRDFAPRRVVGGGLNQFDFFAFVEPHLDDFADLAQRAADAPPRAGN